MQKQTFRVRAFAFVAGAAILAFSGWVGADPPSRVARLGYMSGAVSFSAAGENDWVQATINRPLTTSDRLWTDARGRAEIQIGGAMFRMHADTGISVLNLDDRIAQLQLTQGVVNVHVRRLDRSQVYEVDTPNLAFTLRQAGDYRIEVAPDGSATTVIVRKGMGDVYGEGASYVVDSRQPYRFYGTGLNDYETVGAPRLDEFDRWSSDRDRRYDNSRSARYVSQDVLGYQDLDANGTWRVDPSYGNVWIPNGVDSGWAPYRDGHWAWVDPWGWTWVDDAPWGFAVSHYGRWTNIRGTWGWVPGPVRTQAYYAPALVAFVGGANFQLSISGGGGGDVGWFPLGPREVYRPSYAVSRRYFENVNRSNTVINNTVINNYYNNTNVTNVVYANRQVPGAVVAVPSTVFAQSQPVSRAAHRVSREAMQSAPVAFNAPVAPTQKSVHGAAAQGDKPPARVFERAVVARTAPPAPPAGFAAQQQQLTARHGKPLDEAARKEIKPAAAAPAFAVNVVAQKQAAPPTMRPPPTAPGARPGDARGRPAERNAVAAPSTPGTPAAGSQAFSTSPSAPQPGKAAAPQTFGVQPQAAPPQSAPPAATAQPRDQRGQREQRGQTATPPAGTAPPQAAPPQAATPIPSGQPPQQRGPGESRGPAAAPPPAAPFGAAKAPIAAPPPAAPLGTAKAPTATPPAAAQPPEQRGPREARGQPAASPPAAPFGAAKAPVAAPPPASQPPEQRGPREAPGQPAAPPVGAFGAAKAPVATPPAAAPPTEQRGPREARGQPAAPPVAPFGAAKAPIATPPAAAQPPEQRGPREARGQPAAPPVAPAPPPVAAPKPTPAPPPVPAAKQAPPFAEPKPAPPPAAAKAAPPPPPAPAAKARPFGEAPPPPAAAKATPPPPPAKDEGKKKEGAFQTQ